MNKTQVGAQVQGAVRQRAGKHTGTSGSGQPPYFPNELVNGPAALPHVIAALVLLLFAASHIVFLLVRDSGHAQPNVVFPALQNWHVFLAAAVVEIAAGTACMTHRRCSFADLVILTFVAVMVWYRWAFHFAGGQHCGCLGILGKTLQLRKDTESLLSVGVLVLLILMAVPGLVRVMRCRCALLSTALPIAFILGLTRGAYASEPPFADPPPGSSDEAQSPAGQSRGYEAIGYLTYTAFDLSERPKRKRVLFFDVKVQGRRWHIRTEPGHEGSGGIGFFEASPETNGGVLRITGFSSAPTSIESPLERFRRELEELASEDLSFSNPPSIFPKAISNAEPSASASKSTNRLNNVAVALVLAGGYPPVDSSEAALLWFAFTPQAPHLDGKKELLLQTWDDGNPASVRFRQASWTKFPELPSLVQEAVYCWAGKELMADGQLRILNVTGLSDPLATAAHYEVLSTTNFLGLRLPRNFILTRYPAKEGAITMPPVLTTLQGFVSQVRALGADQDLFPKFPGRTFITDYRVSHSLKNTPLRYSVDSNTLPTAAELRKGKLYARMLAEVRGAGWRLYVAWAVLGLLCLPLCFFWTLRRRFSRPSKRRSPQD